jgi:hypothetical protein
MQWYWALLVRRRYGLATRAKMFEPYARGEREPLTGAAMRNSRMHDSVLLRLSRVHVPEGVVREHAALHGARMVRAHGGTF